MSRARASRSGRASSPDFEFVPDLPSRAAIRDALAAIGEPCGIRAIAGHLGVSGKPALNALRRRLAAMSRDGQLVPVRGSRFGLAERMDLVAGHVISHRDGFGFVRPEAGGDDIYLAPREARRTLHGDKVLVRIAGMDRRERPYGNLVEVIERANEQVVGRYFRDAGIGYVVPDNSRINQDVLIPAGAEGEAGDGQIVVAVIERQPDRHSQPIGRIVEILGEHMAPGMEIEIAIRSHNLPTEWPEAASAEAAAVPPEVAPRDVRGRRDLRELPLVTIDGVDARDFDDAVYARQTAKGFVLFVAIADVAHYVTPGSALDAEAQNRGTSVYFPDRVVPMLPESLSNGICSLRPGVDRLAMVCEMTVSSAGEVRRAKFYDAVIRSHARLIYEQVQDWRDGRVDAPRGIDDAVGESLRQLYALFAAFGQRRRERGALDLDSVEPKFHYDRNGKIERVTSTRRVDAHRVIEECMIAANVAAARYLGRRKAAALYRVHDAPDDERIEELAEFLRGLGIRVRPSADARTFSRVLNAARGRPDRRLIETIVMRTMKLAQYSPENAGHFGLALDAYAHFTSPIRRYPDLVVHRALKHALGGPGEPLEASMEELAARTSMCERRADEATREAVAWLKCEFMLDKVGERFPGIVSGVAEFGVFVELDEIFVEGLVHVTELPGDYYQFDAARHVLRGRSHGGEYRIGEPIEVTVARVDLEERKIDFSVAAGSPRRRRRR
ncbi:MAG: ribonuclease R [Gammaproteobacteria bacterium]